jgi:aspartyl-tRNA(Asn)/glutamyl-tRNA(Gln) amidotransferase subunit A
MLTEQMSGILKDYDFILSPTAPTVAFRFGEKSGDPTQMYLADIYTVLANIVGMPAISLPLAEDSEGMPIGIQLMAGKHEDAKLMGFAGAIRSNNAQKS